MNINFGKPMKVYKVDGAYKKPYHRLQMIYVDKSSLTSAEEFTEFLDDFFRWDEGDYVLKAQDRKEGTVFFAKFQVRDGEVELTRKPDRIDYLCWEFFEESDSEE